jgi:hypothetical protein
MLMVRSMSFLIYMIGQSIPLNVSRRKRASQLAESIKTKIRVRKDTQSFPRRP